MEKQIKAPHLQEHNQNVACTRLAGFFNVWLSAAQSKHCQSSHLRKNNLNKIAYAK